MVPNVAADSEGLDGFEASILTVLAQLPPNPALNRERDELRNRLTGKALRIADVLIGNDESNAEPAEREAAAALSRWGRLRQPK